MPRTRETIFDGRIRGPHTVVCPRDIATLDGLGATVAASVPRYDAPSLATDQAEWSTVYTPGGSGNLYQILGSGRDHDGVTPLALLYGNSSQQARIVRGDSYTITSLDWARSGGTPDVLNGKANAKANHRHIPISAVICEGIIFVACKVTVSGTLTYECILYSQDLGVTWNFVLPRTADAKSGDTDYPTPVTGSSGKERLQHWAFKNFFPRTFGSDLLEAWFHCSDYLGNTGSPGGQGYIFRATRAAVGSAWTVSQLRTVETVLGTGRHLHSGAVTFKSGSLEVIDVYGDGAMSEVRRHTFAGAPEDFLTASITTNRVSGDGTFTTAHRSAYQGAGVVVHPDGDVLCSPDNEYGGIQKITLPATAANPVEIKTIFGTSFGQEDGNLGLHIHCDKPHDPANRAYIAHYQQREKDRTSVPFITIASDSFAYGTDGDNFAIVRGGCERPHIYGNNLIAMTATGYSLISKPRPSTAVRRPMVCQPGGTNIALGVRNGAGAAGATAATGNVALKCTWDGSNLKFHASSPYPGEIIPGPHPFPVGTDVYYWAMNPATATRDDTYMGEFYMVDAVASGYTGGVGTFGLWHRAVGFSSRGLGIKHSLGWGTGGDGYGAPIKALVIADNAAWHQGYIHRSTGAQFHPFIIMECGGATERVNEFLTAAAFAGHGPTFPYAIPYNTTGVGEYNRITGLELDPAGWTTAITLQIPDKTPLDSRTLADFRASWPLVTLYANANNYIIVTVLKGADSLAAQSIKAEVFAAGVSVGSATIAGIYTVPGSQLIIGLSSDGTDTTLSVSINGLPVDSATASNAVTAAIATEWRIGNADASEMIPLRVFKVYEQTASQDATGLESFVTSRRAITAPISAVEDAPPASVFRRR